MQSQIGTSYADAEIKDYLWSTLKSGQVVPGYGHAVLRRPDPRFKALMDFASSTPEIAEDPLFRLVKKNSEIAPDVLKEHGKVINMCCRSRLAAVNPADTHGADQKPLSQR